jgi:predicted alpha-1,6-mannanase (GH76 family)
MEKYGLLTETFPVDPNNQITYLADGETKSKSQEVSYLWPYSGMLSGAIALYKNTGDEAYLDILKDRILPGLELYWDKTRKPKCYQSYPAFNGNSDRFYDDNDWLAIDFCELYDLTKDKKYLSKAETLYKYIYSGWDDKLGGGIYWCEQKKTSKNTCSNAPAAVLSMKLYNLTGKKAYLEQAIKTYEWTKKNLRDPEDGVYWDNVRMDGSVDKAKYTYNSGQMILAGVLLYNHFKDEKYLQDAKQTAAGAYKHFTRVRHIDQEDRLFYTANPWFNVILLRGQIALAEIDGNTTYIDTMLDNALYAWRNNRDGNGFLSPDWSGIDKKKHKWLLDNACMVELFAELPSKDTRGL